MLVPKKFQSIHNKKTPWSLIGFAFLVFGFIGFLKFASEVVEGEAAQLDEWLLLIFRNSNDLSHPIGPEWLLDSMLNITALGSGPVLTLITAIVTGCLIASRQYARSAWFLSVIVLAQALNYFLKHAYSRPRPTIVPHLTIVGSDSFPSGHSMMSAVVYLSIAALFSPLLLNRRLRVFVIFSATIISFLVSLSRVYLGVHYPTDVIAGWAFGSVWAIGTHLLSKGQTS